MEPSSCREKSSGLPLILHYGELYNYFRGFPGGSAVKNLPAMQEMRVQSLGWEDPLEEGMAIHSNILAWEIPWTGEPGSLQSMGSKSQTHTHNYFIIYQNVYDRNKVHNKCNEIESPQNHHPSSSLWKICPPQNWSLVPKTLGITTLFDLSLGCFTPLS